MRAGLYAFMWLTALAPFASAQTVDKAKLRQSIEMPSASLSLGVQFRSHERDSRGNRFEPAQKIAELDKKLTGKPDDAAVYIEQYVIYLESLRDEKKAKEVAAKAEALLRPLVNTTDSAQGYLLTYYATVLESMVDNPWNDCEKWARRAVSVAPQDWRTWTYLAHTRRQQIPAVIVGGDEKRLPKERRTQEVLASLHQRRLHAEHVDAAEKVLNEIAQYHDKAKEIAPNDPKRQEQRYGFRLGDTVMRNAISVYRGQKEAFPMGQLERVVLDELEAAARLNPEHLLWQSQLAHQLIIVGWHASKDNAGKPSKTFRPARPEDDKTIRTALARIDAIAGSSKGESAIFCRSMLAALCALMQDHAGAETQARKILELDPQHQSAAEQLQQAMFSQDKKTEQLQFAQAHAERNRTARNCFLLAKSLAWNQRYDLAENMCLAGIRLDASDVHCLLGLAALTMRKSDAADALKLTNELIDKARRALRPDDGPNVAVEIDYLASVHQALSGEAAFARLKLERLRADYPDTPRFAAALNAIR